MTKTSRRKFGKQLAEAIAVLPVTGLIASAQTKKARKSPGQVKILQSSPITVGGGGSVGVDFSETYYKKVPQTDKYVNTSNDTIHKLWIIDKHGTMTDCPLPRPNCTIKIHAKHQSVDSPIEIYGAPMGLKFAGSEYPLDLPEPGSTKKIHLNKNRKITDRIEITDNATGAVTYCDVPTNGQCTIIAVNTL